MQKIVTTLKDILTPLCKRQKDLWVNENWKHIFVDWPPLAREDIEVLFRPPEAGLNLSKWISRNLSAER